MKNYTFKTILLAPKAQANKTDINIIFLLFVENCLSYDAIHNFSVWLSTSSYPADINQFRSHTGKKLLSFYVYRHINLWNILKLKICKIRKKKG